jgi:hypothetical protein
VYVPVDSPRVSLSVVSPMAWETNWAAEIARRRALDRLRDAALSYAVDLTMVRLGGGDCYWSITADGAESRLDEVIAELVDALEGLACAGPTDDELATLHSMAELARHQPDRVIEYLDSCARWHLFDHEILPREDHDALVDAFTTESLRAELAGSLDTMLAIGPERGSERLGTWTQHGGWSAKAVPGRRLEPITGRERGALVVGQSGVTWRCDDERFRTVRWDDVEACFADGDVRILTSSSGTQVIVSPSNWRGGEDLARRVDASIEPSRLVRYTRPEAVARDGDAPRADHRWLATISARSTTRGSDALTLVLDTDGVFVIHEASAEVDRADRLRALRTAGRDELLGLDLRNRWIAHSEVAAVELRRGFVDRVRRPQDRRLQVVTKNGEKLVFRLPGPDSVSLAREQFPRVLGARFRDETNGAASEIGAGRAGF